MIIFVFFIFFFSFSRDQPISTSFSSLASSWILRQPANGLAIVFLRSVLQLSDLCYFPFISCVWVFDTEERENNVTTVWGCRSGDVRRSWDIVGVIFGMWKESSDGFIGTAVFLSFVAMPMRWMVAMVIFLLWVLDGTGCMYDYDVNVKWKWRISNKNRPLL